ncbi:MAG TPA: polysaccharide pyruvyl transferase family protein [Candidatus Ozemobacteraceae bacterium]|nr:polysaccharide pyruvyl transferase family protein [Candidatus Ozemobacteraceae bacterium]
MNALLVGFFGEGNLGDEAILQGVLQTLPSSRRLLVTAGRHRPVSGPLYLPRQGLLAWHQFIQSLPTCRHLWFAGGILQDWSFAGTTFFGLRVLAAHHLGRTPGFWGAGIGPLHRRASRRFVKRVLRYPDPVWLRDQQSVDLYHTLTGRQAHLGADWSWALEPTVTPRASAVAGRLGLNLRPWFNPDCEEHVRLLLGNRLQTSSLCGISARPEDSRLIRQMVSGIEIFSFESFSELLSIATHLREGWAMRYHVVLAMLRANLPTIPLPYDEKVRALCEEAGIPLPADPGQAPFVACRPATDFPRRLQQRFQSMRAAFLAELEKDS